MYTTLIKPLFADVKTFVLDTLFPITCLACDKEDKDFICQDCRMWLTKLEFQRCIICQKPAGFGMTHPGCKTPFCADGLISFYDYHDDKVARAIIKGKYNFLPAAFETLASIISTKISPEHQNLLKTNACNLTPIPLHPSRKRWRGFNQAEIICRSLSLQLNLPVTDVLQRKKATKTQKDLKKGQRLKNVDGAFKLIPGTGVRGQNFIIVDDVTTTGATLLEAAKVLKRNGAESVWCLTVARD